MEEKIAIDVALLLPESLNSTCRKLNKGSDEKNYISFRDGYNPHITLGMGSLFVRDINALADELESLLKKIKIPEITIISLGSKKYAEFEVEPSADLKKLHNAVFDLITKYDAGAVIPENFFETPGSDSLIKWVNNFKKNNAYSLYNPHITLGVGITKVPLDFPITFKPAAIGLFHLGIHGTCKKALFRYNLK